MMRRFLYSLAAAGAVVSAHATVTVTSNVSTLPGGNAPTAIVKVTIQNCASPSVWNTGQIIPATQNFPVVRGTATITLHDNVTEVACQGNFLSYYSFALVSGGITTPIGDYELPPGRFNLANLAPVTTPPTSPGILQGPAGPRGPAGPSGTGGGGGPVTSTAYRLGAYTSGVSGGTGTLTGSNITTDSTGSDIAARNVTAATVATAGTGAGWVTMHAGNPPAPTPSTATIASDTSGNALVSEAGGSLTRICTVGNGQCAGSGSGGPPTSTALRVGTYTSGISGSTGTLTGSNLTTDATGSDLGARNITASSLATGSSGAGSVVLHSGTTPGPSTSAAGITTDTSGNLLAYENGGATARLCTAANGACPGGASSTSTAYRFGAYTNSVSGGNGTLTGSNVTTDATGSDIGARNVTSNTLSVINTNCAHISSFGTMTCEEVNNNAQFRYRSGGSGLNNLRFDLWQVTGPGWNIGPVLGTIHNQGWSVMIQHESPATMFTRGIHEGEGDGGFGWQCFAVGDCIHRYDYDFYDGGSPDPSAESKKWLATIQTESQGFFHGTVSSSLVTAGTAPYPTTSKIVAINLSGTSGPNHITDGTKLMYDPNTAGTTTCSFNGTPSNWSAGAQIGRIPITGCTGAAVPTLYAWGTISALIGDQTANGQQPSNVPVQQTWTVTPSSGSPAFAAPDGTNEWKSHVCIVGVNYIENSRLESVSGSSLTMDIRYPNNGPVLVLQGPACAPYQSVSIDSSLTYGQQATSFWSFGTIDGGATLLISAQAGGGVGWNAIFRPGQAPWTTTAPGSGPNTAAFHLVNSSEIVANLAPNAFSPVSAQVEDNAFLPTNGTAIWDPHFNSVSSMALSIVDGTSQYGGGAAASGIGYFTYAGPRISSAYQPMFFWNTNPISMYKTGGGWADPPNSVISSEGPHQTFVDMGHAPTGAFATIHNVYGSVTDWDLFRLPHHTIGVHEDSGTLSYYIDFSSRGAAGIRSSYISLNKDGVQTLGLAKNLPEMAIGATIDQTDGSVSTDGVLHLHNLITDLINGAAPGTGSGGTGATVASAETVTFSATPTFSTATNVSRIVLTAAITSFTLGAGADGQSKTLCFKQGAGGYSVTPPSNVHGFFSVGSVSGSWNCQAFTYDLSDSIWLATSTGLLNE